MSTLADVTARLEQINGEGVRQRDDIVAGLELVAEAIENSGMSQEQMLENARHQAKMLELLEGIKNGQKPGGAGGEGGDAGNIGLMGGILGAALGGLTGAIIGYAKAWRDMIKAVMPNKMLEIGRNAMNSVRNFFNMVGERFSNFMKRVGDLFKNDGPVGRVASFFGDIGTKIADFFKPITEAIGKMKGTGDGLAKVFKPITDGFGKVMGFFRTIGSSLSGFGVMFRAVATVMGKIFYPLTIILTAYDTIKGVIEGFTEDGIVGGILGAVEGFFTSLVTVPLDMIKSAISWVAGALGFERAEEVLDSFSFTDVFSSVIDSIKEFIFAIPGYIVSGFDWLSEQMSTIGDAVMEGVTVISDAFNEYIIDPIKGMFDRIKGFFSDMADQIIGFVSNLGIPAITFSIPLYGDVTLGPWYPFRDESQAETAAISGNLGHSGGVENTKELDNGGLTNIVARDSAGATVAERNRYAMGDIVVEGINQRGDSYGSVTGLKTGETRQFSGDVSNQDMLRIIAGVQPEPVGDYINNDSVAIADANRDAQTSGGNTNVVAPTTNNVTNQSVAGPRRSARNQDPTANVAFSPVG